MRDKKTGRFTSDGNGKPSVNPSSSRGIRDEVAQLNELVSNALTSRAQLMRAMIDPRRDINQECGYPATEQLTGEHYRLMYDREAVATRVVEVLSEESWKAQPEVFESEDVDEETDFEIAWKELPKSLTLDSWYEDKEGGNPIWEYLHRADKLSGIGSYGILLLGIDDGLELSEPIAGADRTTKPGPGQNRLQDRATSLIYLRVFDESLATIAAYESNKTSPRYGQPIIYDVTFGGTNPDVIQGAGLSKSTAQVHWTRVIHLADNLGSSEVHGVPRMRPVFNRLWDLRKLYGGSAEMYWQGAFPGLSIETHPQLAGEVSIDQTAMREQMEKYSTGLQRYLTSVGMLVKSLAPQVVDPTPQINMQLDAICIRLGIPKRILVGSERGELASSQDKKTWNDRLRYRQANYITPRIIVTFIDRLILIGVLPEPREYSVVWPDLDALTESEQADVAVKRTEAMAKYVQGSVEALMVPLDYFTRVLNLPQDEAEAVLKNTMSELGSTSTLDIGKDDEEEASLKPEQES